MKKEKNNFLFTFFKSAFFLKVYFLSKFDFLSEKKKNKLLYLKT